MIRALEAQGWRIEERRHYIAYPPDRTKRALSIPRTPGKHNRSIENTRADLRRLGAVLP